MPTPPGLPTWATGTGVNVDGAPDTLIAENIISGNASHGVSISGAGAVSANVLDNFIGADATGAVDLGNDGAGIFIAGAANAYLVGNALHGNGTHGITVSGVAAETIIGVNSITDNGSDGVRINGSGVSSTLVRLNLIGTDADGDTDLGNGGSGVHIGNGSFDNLVDENTIAFSGGDGVTIVSATASGNTVWENAIYSNTGLGIDLAPDGVTANDAGDVDTGSNNLQNFPVLSAAARNETEIGVYGDLNASPNAGYAIDFYSNSVCDASGNGEGKAWFGYAIAFTDATGEASISGSFPATELVGSFITAAATANPNLDGSTSEFSACMEAATLPDLELPEGISVNEGGMATYDVVLAEQPSEDVTVYLMSGDGAVATVATSSLPFNVDNWDTPQTVTVTGVADANATDSNTDILQVIVHGGNNYNVGRVAVEVFDDDLPELTLSDDSLTVAEGSSASYTMQLAAEPTGPVTVSLPRPPGTQLPSPSRPRSIPSPWTTGTRPTR